MAIEFALDLNLSFFTFFALLTLCTVRSTKVTPNRLDGELAIRPVRSLEIFSVTIDLSKIVDIKHAEACWRELDENVEWGKGEILLHVKRGFGGRGQKGGISAFCKRVGISPSEASELMRVAFLWRSKKVSARADRFLQSGGTISHMKRATRNLDFDVDKALKKGSVPEKEIERYQKRLDHIQAEKLTVAQTEDYVRQQNAEEKYEKEHGPSIIDLKTIKTANVMYIEQPEDIAKYAHGSVPEEIMENIIWVYVDEGDLVLDPMAGTGTVAKVCRKYGYRCLSYDKDPDCYECNDDIEFNDIRRGLPDEVWEDPPAFIFYDPPYFNKRKAELRRVGKDPPFEDYPEFHRFVRYNVDLAARALREGGYVGFIVMDYLDTDTENEKPNEFRYGVGLSMRGEIYRALADHPDLIIEEGWQVPIPPGRRGRRHGLVRTDKGVVGCARDLWIAKKVSWKPFLICPLCKDLYSNPLTRGEKATKLDYWPVVCESCATRLEEKFRGVT